MADRVSFRCHACQHVVKVPNKHLGRKVSCPKCASVFRAGEKKQSLALPKRPAAQPSNPKPPTQSRPTQPIFAQPAHDVAPLAPAAAQPVIAPPIAPPPIAPPPIAPTQMASPSMPVQPPPTGTALPGVGPTGQIHNTLTPQPLPAGLMAPIPSSLPPVMTTQPPEPDLLSPDLASAKTTPPTPRNRREAIERGKKHVQQKSVEMDDFSSNLQSSGVFLVVLPLIATVLPLIGLQHRRLRNLGDAAPLGAMFLGLIGAGCIAYARRDKGDSAIVGAAAALFTLVCGVGGYFMVSELSTRESASKSSYGGSAFGDFGETGPGEKLTPSEVEMQGNARMEERRRRKRRDDENRFQPPNLDRDGPNSGAPNSANPARGQGSARGNLLNSKGWNDGRSNVPENPNQANNDPFEDDVPDSRGTPPPDSGVADQLDEAKKNEDPFEAEPSNEVNPNTKNPFGSSDFVESLPNGFRGADARQSSFRKWGQGMLTFARQRNKKKLEKGLKFGQTVGEESKSGHLFAFSNPILGVEVLKVGSPAFIPIEEDDFPSENAIAKDNRVLAGFNLAFDDGNMLGIQGIFAATKDGKADLEDLKETHWLGLKTEDVAQAMAGSKKIHGFVCYTDGRDIIGFALVLKR